MLMKSFKFLLAVLLLAALAGVSDARADSILYGTIGFGWTGSTLVQISPSTGALIRTIGPVGYLVNGLTFDPLTGRLYGSTSYRDLNYNGLIEIDLSTGAGTPVGLNYWGAPAAQAIIDIDINADRQMYGWAELLDNGAQDDLVSIDRLTGIGTWVGDSGIGTATLGLAFDANNVLWLVNHDGNYYTIDTGTGVATYVGNIGRLAHHGDFDPATGIYYGISTYNWDNPRFLVLADLTGEGFIEEIETVDNLHTLAFAPVPEPASLTLLGIGVLSLVGLGRRYRRR